MSFGLSLGASEGLQVFKFLRILLLGVNPGKVQAGQITFLRRPLGYVKNETLTCSSRREEFSLPMERVWSISVPV